MQHVLPNTWTGAEWWIQVITCSPHISSFCHNPPSHHYEGWNMVYDLHYCLWTISSKPRALMLSCQHLWPQM